MKSNFEKSIIISIHFVKNNERKMYFNQLLNFFFHTYIVHRVSTHCRVNWKNTFLLLHGLLQALKMSHHQRPYYSNHRSHLDIIWFHCYKLCFRTTTTNAVNKPQARRRLVYDIYLILNGCYNKKIPGIIIRLEVSQPKK